MERIRQTRTTTFYCEAEILTAYLLGLPTQRHDRDGYILWANDLCNDESLSKHILYRTER